MAKLLFTFCEGCPEACDEGKAESLMRARRCDPCDACFNEASPACRDCSEFDCYEPCAHSSDEPTYPTP